jgi:hypothetical protein
MLRLKMQVSTVKSCADQDGNKSSEELTFNAAYGPKGSANEQWCKWTPCANLSFTISNPDAFGKALPGMFVYVDITPTTKDAL